MEVEQTPELTEAETKLYDRQIRVWGLESQKRLGSARILVAGLKGLGCEVAKNLVLAGVQSMVLLDHNNLAEEDLYAQFLAPRTCLGKNRAASSQARLQALNPRVKVSVDTSDILTKDAKFFSEFDVAVITECYNKEAIVKLNHLCRDANTQFFAGNVFGFFGYFFEDFGLHCFEQENKIVGKVAPGESETQILKQRMRFPTFGEVLKFNWMTKKRNLRASNSEPCFFITMMLFEYFNQHQGRPNVENREVTLKQLKTARDIVHNNYALPENKIPEEILPMLFSEASPVASMIGGSLSQEVIKAITKRGMPLKNFVFYNALTYQLTAEVIGKTKMTFPSDEEWEVEDEERKIMMDFENDDDATIEIVSVVEAS